ncbi:type 1 fimbrial protein [Escherichia coli]|nr:type 1 fimbrial protein [Escherichia coli]
MRSDFPVVVITSGFQNIKPLLFHDWPVHTGSSAAGSAQNVGIQILDRTGEVLILDGATFSAKTDLIDGTNILPFQARYIALGQSVAGTANADATFKVQYL